MAEPLLAAEGLRRSYAARRGSTRRVQAVDGVDLAVEAGGSLGIVGSTGAGKSTLARLLLALERPDEGSVIFDGHAISRMRPSQVRPLRRRFQAVFQDPMASLDPRLRVATSVVEPLTAFGLGTSAERRRRAGELLATVGLDPKSGRRYPGAFSGGERQRIAIARAMAVEPELLVLDEPVSFLDVAVQAQILDLIVDLRARHRLTLVLISHDLHVVRRVSDRVVVVYRGVVVESGTTEEVLTTPAHPHTAALVDATPRPDPGWLHQAPVRNDAGRSWSAGACRFADRCTRSSDACTTEPELKLIDPSHSVRCHHPVH